MTLRRTRLGVLRLGVLAAILCAAPALPAAAQSATAPLKNAEGKEVGSANLTQTPHGVLINISVKGLPPGEHAFHVHAVGKSARRRSPRPAATSIPATRSTA